MMFLNEMSQPDKALHMIAGAVIAVLSVVVVAMLGHGFFISALAGGLASLAAGVLKERIDQWSAGEWWPFRYRGTADTLDIVATVIGGVPAAVIASAVYAVFA